MHRLWQGLVKLRDQKKCVICENTNKDGRLIAHHLISFHKDPLRRYDVSNGITLCAVCHGNYHGKNISKEELKQYIPINIEIKSAKYNRKIWERITMFQK